MTAFRLALDLGEETRARWRAAAERIGYERLDVWAYDTLDAAADPDAGQVVGVETIGDPERVELRGRLTTAETELAELRVQGEHMVELVKMKHDAEIEATDRLEALIRAMVDEGYDVSGLNVLIAAALACPPQQRGE